MSRESYDSVTGKWLPSEHYYALKATRKASAARSELAAPMLVRDTNPYRSVITGEMIDGRRQHRDHLRAHGCVEVGNDWRPSASPAAMPPVAQDIKRAMEQGPPPEMKPALERAQQAV